MCSNKNTLEDNQFNIEKSAVLNNENGVEMVVAQARSRATGKLYTAIFEGGNLFDVVTNDPEAFSAWVEDIKGA